MRRGEGSRSKKGPPRGGLRNLGAARRRRAKTTKRMGWRRRTDEVRSCTMTSRCRTSTWRAKCPSADSEGSRSGREEEGRRLTRERWESPRGRRAVMILDGPLEMVDSPSEVSEFSWSASSPISPSLAESGSSCDCVRSGFRRRSARCSSWRPPRTSQIHPSCADAE